jgi:two-component system CheB/CheR fusion protein
MPETTRKEYMDELLERYKADSLQPLLVNKVDKAGTALRISLVASPLINDAGEIYAIATTERALQA